MPGQNCFSSSKKRPYVNTEESFDQDQSLISSFDEQEKQALVISSQRRYQSLGGDPHKQVKFEVRTAKALQARKGTINPQISNTPLEIGPQNSF